MPIVRVWKKVICPSCTAPLVDLIAYLRIVERWSCAQDLRVVYETTCDDIKGDHSTQRKLVIRCGIQVETEITSLRVVLQN